MTFLEMAEKRFSVRRFDGREVSQEVIDRILEAAKAAPSGHNAQSSRILALKRREDLERLKECTPCHYHAPLAFVISFDKTTCWQREIDGAVSGPIDASIVGTHMMFEAYEQGVGSCWVMGFNPMLLKQIFHMPDSLEPVLILVCGYPSTDVRPSSRHASRLPVEEFTTYDDYKKEKGHRQV